MGATVDVCGYSFEVHKKGTEFGADSRIYIYAKYNSSTYKYELIYIGKTNDLNRRVYEHENNSEKADICIRNSGYTHILTYALKQGETLTNIETELLKKYNCKCNTQNN